MQINQHDPVLNKPEETSKPKKYFTESKKVYPYSIPSIQGIFLFFKITISELRNLIQDHVCRSFCLLCLST